MKSAFIALAALAIGTHASAAALGTLLPPCCQHGPGVVVGFGHTTLHVYRKDGKPATEKEATWTMSSFASCYQQSLNQRAGARKDPDNQVRTCMQELARDPRSTVAVIVVADK